jgi:Ca2+-binding EF-hand superfamily protein
MNALASEKSVRELFALNAADGSENMAINDLKELLGHRHKKADNNQKHIESFDKLWQEFLCDFKV